MEIRKLKFAEIQERWHKSQRYRLEVGPGGEAVVDAGGSDAEGGGGVAFGEPAGEFGADAGLEVD